MTFSPNSELGLAHPRGFFYRREVRYEAVAYRWSQEVSAMGKLSQEELEMVYKIGFKPTDYLAYK